MNFFIFLILLVKVFVKCDSSCEIENKYIRAVQQMFWTKDKYYLYYEIEHRPLKTFLRYFKEKTVFENIVDVKFPKLQCDIEMICTTTKSNVVKRLEERNYYSFCEQFFIFEHKKEYIFTIDHLQLALFSYQNITMNSNQLFKKSGINFFNTR